MQEIKLNGYCAQTDGPLLRLGTWGSYGIEQLKILPGEGWEGLTITATFVTPQTSIRMAIGPDGLVQVPQEATAQPLSQSDPPFLRCKYTYILRLVKIFIAFVRAIPCTFCSGLSNAFGNINKKGALAKGSSGVRIKGLEPPRLSASDPKSDVATNYTISADDVPQS